MATLKNYLSDLGGEEIQAQHPGEIGLADASPLCNFGHCCIGICSIQNIPVAMGLTDEAEKAAIRLAACWSKRSMNEQLGFHASAPEVSCHGQQFGWAVQFGWHAPNIQIGFHDLNYRRNTDRYPHFVTIDNNGRNRIG